MKTTVFGALLLSSACQAQAYTLEEQGPLAHWEDSVLAANGVLKKMDSIPGWVMPLLTFYRVIDAQPNEVAAIYFDVRRHPEYFPDIMSVAVESTSAPSKLILGFEQHVFWFITDKSRVENEFSGTDQAYFLKWHILKSEGAAKGDGLITFRPYRGKTVMRYSVLVQPKTFLMRYSFIRNKAIRRMSDVLAQTAQAVAKEKAEMPDLLKSQLLAMTQMIARK